MELLSDQHRNIITASLTETHQLGVLCIPWFQWCKALQD